MNIGIGIGIGFYNRFGGGGPPTYDNAGAILGLDDGLAIAASDGGMVIKDTTTPANNYTNPAASKLGSVRASAAMQHNAQGSLEWGPENLLLRSQEFSTSWIRNACAITINVITAPDGTLSADQLTIDNITGIHQALQSVTTPSDFINYTLSAYVKYNTQQFIGLGIGGTGGTQFAIACFDLVNGTVTKVGNGSNGVHIASTITPVTGSVGWYRISTTGRITTTTSLIYSKIMFYSNGNPTFGASGDESYLGDGVSSFYVWGAQLERSSALRAYIPTSASIVYGFRRDNDPRLGAGVWGFLAEEARTNNILQSEDLSHAAWTAVGTIVTINQANGPDGLTNLDLLTDTNTSAGIKIGTTVVAGIHTWSVYVRRGNTDWIRLMLYNNLSKNIRVWFNLSGNGSIGANAISEDATFNNASLVNLGGGLFRITMSGQLATQTAYWGQINSAVTDASDVRIAGATYYAGYAQLEGGAFASSYIPTTSAAVTRAADIPALAGTLFPLNQAEGTLYAKCVSMGAAINPGANYSLILDNGSTAEMVQLSRTFGRFARFAVTDGGSNQAVIDSISTIVDMAQSKAAGAYKLNDMAVAQAGELVQADLSGTMPTTTQLIFGNRTDGTRSLSGWLLEAAYINRRLSNSELQMKASGYANDSALLLKDETDGLAFSATDRSMAIKDSSNPANNYTGGFGSKLGNIRASAAMNYGQNGFLEWGPENLLLRSQDFNIAPWSVGSASLVANNAIAPDGSFTADTLTFAAQYGSVVQNIGSGIPGQVYTYSIWMRYLSGHTTLSMTLDHSGTTGITNNKTITPEWQRFSVTFTPTTNNSVAVYVQDRAGGPWGAVEIWGAQLERAASASTYKPTTSSAYYSLRYDWDNRIGGGAGYLVEEARTNLIIGSEIINDASYTKTGVTVVVDQIAAPDGNITADLIHPTSTGNNRYFYQTINKAATPITYTFSVFVKAKNWSWFILQLDNAGVHGTGRYFNAATGALGVSSNFGSGFTLLDSIVTPLANGWYRFTIIVTSNTGSNIRPLILMSDADGGILATTNGTDGLYCWGLSVEAGSFAASYIPTTAAAVTRAVDTPLLSGGFPVNPNEGTLYAKAMHMGQGATSQRMLELSNTNSDRVILNREVTRKPAFVITSGGASQVSSIAAGTMLDFVMSKSAGGYKLDDSAIAQNGEAVVVDNSCLMPVSLANLYFGNGVGAPSPVNGWLLQGSYKLTRKSNAELAAMVA